MVSPQLFGHGTSSFKFACRWIGGLDWETRMGDVVLWDFLKTCIKGMLLPEMPEVP